MKRSKWRKPMSNSQNTDSKNTHSPQTQVLHKGYRPELSEGALQVPIFPTSSWVFPSAEEGKRAFTHGACKQGDTPLVYSRINHPNIEIVEERLTVWDNAEECALFDSGMTAIKTLLDTFLGAGDKVLYSEPLYGGTTSLLKKHYASKWMITLDSFGTAKQLEQKIEGIRKNKQKLKMIFIETPANPTLNLVDIAHTVEQARKCGALVVVDNTFLGPIFQHPLKLGADIVVYSATKYIGGHSAVVAGACLGSHELIEKIKTNRASFGGIPDPFTAWLLGISLETLELRMRQQAKNAKNIALNLSDTFGMDRVYYLGNHLARKPDQRKIYKKQCVGEGAMISFNIPQGEEAIFRFLDALSIFKNAVSLGGTHSLVCHPASTTHLCISEKEQKRAGIQNLVRLSIGLEDPNDLIADLENAFEVSEIW